MKQFCFVGVIGVIKDISVYLRLGGVMGDGASEFAREIEAFSQWGCSQGGEYAVQMSIHVCAYLWGRQEFRHQV